MIRINIADVIDMSMNHGGMSSDEYLALAQELIELADAMDEDDED